MVMDDGAVKPDSIVAGILRPDVVSGARLSSNISVNWNWHDQQNGTIQWDFKNNGQETQSVILLRSGYYFGGAFWPVYVNNPQFGTIFAQQPVPLVNNGLDKNNPPLAVIRFPDGTLTVCFVFTLAPGQAWSMVEGGFSSQVVPNNVSVHLVTQSETMDMCIGYDQMQVYDWDRQTGSGMQGYSPNPRTFKTVLCDVSASDIRLFKDPISLSACSVSLNQNSGCIDILLQAKTDLTHGNLPGAIDYIVRGIECEIASHVVTVQEEIPKPVEKKEKKRRFRRLKKNKKNA